MAENPITLAARITGPHDVVRVEPECAALFNFSGVFKKNLQGACDGGEGKLIPWDFGFGKHAHLKTFLAGSKFQIEQPGAIKEMHLMKSRQVDQ